MNIQKPDVAAAQKAYEQSEKEYGAIDAKRDACIKEKGPDSLHQCNKETGLLKYLDDNALKTANLLLARLLNSEAKPNNESKRHIFFDTTEARYGIDCVSEMVEMAPLTTPDTSYYTGSRWGDDLTQLTSHCSKPDDQGVSNRSVLKDGWKKTWDALADIRAGYPSLGGSVSLGCAISEYTKTCEDFLASFPQSEPRQIPYGDYKLVYQLGATEYTIDCAQNSIVTLTRTGTAEVFSYFDEFGNSPYFNEVMQRCEQPDAVNWPTLDASRKSNWVKSIDFLRHLITR